MRPLVWPYGWRCRGIALGLHEADLMSATLSNPETRVWLPARTAIAGEAKIEL